LTGKRNNRKRKKKSMITIYQENAAGGSVSINTGSEVSQEKGALVPYEWK
jgi:hypothetical protein